jgi:RND family efflux transporter MFP subunit
MRRRWRTILVGACAVAVASLWLAARGDDRPPVAPAPHVASGSAARWSTLQVGKAVPGTPRWTDPVPARVVIDETRTSRVGSPLDGRVTQVMVQRGQHVTAGTPLFAVASGALADLIHDRDRALVEEQAAKAALDRTQSLVDTNFAPEKDLLQARQDYEEAQVAARLAQAKLAALKVSSKGDGAFVVTAPRDGVIVERNVDLGQTVTAEAGGLVVIADLSHIWVVADLFEQDVGKLAPGARAQVTVSTAPGMSFEGTVEQVGTVIDPDRMTVPVRVGLDNHAGVLRPYSRAQGRFLDPSPAPVEVPAPAVLSDGDQSYVYVPRGDGFARQNVVAGSPHEGMTPIYRGLAVGDAVVVRGAPLLDNQVQP